MGTGMAIGESDDHESVGARGRRAIELIYDPKVRGLFFQAVLLISLILFFYWIISNTVTNLAEQNKQSGFGFLGDVAGFKPATTPGTWAIDYRNGVSTYLDIFWVGIINTLAVSVIGIFFATIIGFVIGIFRLSSNVILNGFATVYVEVLRNIPLLVQILVWYRVVIALLPDKRDEPINVLGPIAPGTVSLDKSGLWAPYPIIGEGFILTLAAAALAIVGWIALSVWARRQRDATGRTFPVFWVGLGALILLPAIVFLLSGSPLAWEHPIRGTFGFRVEVGMVMKPEFFAVFAALTLYTAAFIAEIVRAGILAVNKGQSEASSALGLSRAKTLNLVIIPQALRVIVPPLTSQYLNLIKNSSLAGAAGYPDLVQVFAGTALNQVGQEIEIIFMMMMVYLFFSLTISAFMNWYNRSIALVER